MRSSYAFDGRHLRQWLARIMSNLFIDDCRAVRRQPQIDAFDDTRIPQPAPESPPAWVHIEVSQHRAAVDRLPERYREVYRLRAFEHLSYKQIAERMDININTVGSKLGRARKKLLEILKSLLPEEIEE